MSHKHSFMKFSVFCLLLTAFRTQGAEIQLLAKGSQLTEIVSGLKKGQGTLEGDRGCSGTSDNACPASARIMAARNSFEPGETVSAAIAGAGKAALVQALLNGTVISEQRDVQLPAEVIIPAVLNDGDEVTVRIETAEGTFERTASASRASSNSASIGTIRNFVEVYYSGITGGFYEVIEGSGTGGRFISSSRGCVVPWSPCPANLRVLGYTDRASRGEWFASQWNGSGTADRLGWRYYGSGKVEAWSNVALPTAFETVLSTNAADDYLYSFAQNPYRELHVPIGTRPSPFRGVGH